MSDEKAPRVSRASASGLFHPAASLAAFSLNIPYSRFARWALSVFLNTFLATHAFSSLATEDPRFLPMLDQGKLQEAIWLADELGDGDAAHEIEHRLREILLSGPKSYQVNKNAGATTSYIYHYGNTIRSVVKADVWRLSNPLSWIFGDYSGIGDAKQEVYAYEISSAFHLNVVPMTVLIQNGAIYSAQYFVDHAITGDKLHEKLLNKLKLSRTSKGLPEDFILIIDKKNSIPKSETGRTFCFGPYAPSYSFQLSRNYTRLYVENSCETHEVRRDNLDMDPSEFEFLFGQTFMPWKFGIPRYAWAPSASHIGEMLVLDYLLGNLDRHTRNWLYLESTAADIPPRLVAIDHVIRLPVRMHLHRLWRFQLITVVLKSTKTRRILASDFRLRIFLLE